MDTVSGWEKADYRICAIGERVNCAIGFCPNALTAQYSELRFVYKGRWKKC
jgi:hypothetical protein